MELDYSEESEQLEAHSPVPWAMVFSVIGSQVAFVKLVPGCSQEEPPRPHFWGIIGILDYQFLKKVILFGFMGHKCYVYACAYGDWCPVCNHLATQPTL